MLHKLKLTLNPDSDNYEYLIYPVADVRDKQNKDAFSIALPGQSYKENILMGISGQTADIEISFKMHNDGTDKANDSYSSTVVTLDEQFKYLKNTMQAASFITSWELTDINGNYYDALPVFFSNINIPVYEEGSERWHEVRIDLNVGESI